MLKLDEDEQSGGEEEQEEIKIDIWDLEFKLIYDLDKFEVGSIVRCSFML